MTDFEYDVAVSYAGEDKPIVEELVAYLDRKGLKTFFAPSAGAVLVGERLGEFLPQAFAQQSRFVLVVLSESYLRKDWTRVELEAALCEEKRRKGIFVLPLRVDDVEITELLGDKVAIDLRSQALERTAADIVERVREESGEQSARKLFSAAYREWKNHKFIPGKEKGRLFVEHLDDLDLDVERFEFLLRCPWDHYSGLRQTLLGVAPELRIAAGERLLESATTPGFQLSAIAYIGSASPELGERRLREIYNDEEVPINDRARAFAELHKCGREEVWADSNNLLLNSEAPWQFRKAAAVNVLWGPLTGETSAVLARALEDPRLEVRVPVIDAVMKFKLGELTPFLIEAYRRDRSRKSRLRIKTALQLFNDREEAIAFGCEMKFGPSFFEAPSYVHDWEQSREAWL